MCLAPLSKSLEHEVCDDCADVGLAVCLTEMGEKPLCCCLLCSRDIGRMLGSLVMYQPGMGSME